MNSIPYQIPYSHSTPIKYVRTGLLLSFILLLTACSPVKLPVSNQYRLDVFSHQTLVKHSTRSSILISKPEAMAGYQTEQMLYIKKPFELNSFAHNAWIATPADMLYPLEMESLQQTGYFSAVASGTYADKADYRLDTQLIELQQNFLQNPSVMELRVKITLTHVEDNRVIASRIFHECVRCPTNTPYGGVIAGNEAMRLFTEKLSRFVVRQIASDRATGKRR